MSQRRAKGRRSMARVELDVPAGVRVERVRQIASSLIGQLEREPSSNEESLVALMMVADLFGRNAGFSETKIDVLALFAEDCAAQAFDQHAEKIN